MTEKPTNLAKPQTVLDKIQGATKNIAARLPENVDHDKFILGLMTAIQKSKANAQPGKSLLDCDPNSVLLAAYDAAEQGCTLSPSLALGWIIPYGKEAQFQPSYRFFIQRAYQTGEVKSFFAEVVYQGDEFIRTLAPERNLLHRPSVGERKRENAIGAYALIQFIDGTLEYEYLTAEQIDRHRQCSKQQNSMKWKEFWEEGWRITPIRVLAKRLPLKTRKIEELVEAINRDADREIAIPIEQLSEPSAPRRTAEPESEKAQQDKPKAEAQANGHENKGDPKSARSDSMFDDQEFLTGADIREFWNKAVEAGWTKEEVTEMLKKDFGISQPKDLPKAKLQSVLDVIQSARA